MIIAAILIVVAGILYNYSSMTGKISTDELNERYPTFVAENFVAEIYDNQGGLQYGMFSKDITYFQSKDLVQVNHITGMFYENKNHAAPFRGWQISADRGEMVINNYAYLNGHIHVLPNFADAVVKEITTDNLHLDIPKNILSSPAAIYIRGNQFENTGSNYTIDLNNKIFLIKEQPHAVYYPQIDGATATDSSADGM